MAPRSWKSEGLGCFAPGSLGYATQPTPSGGQWLEPGAGA
jgi:hypothetical protein